MTFVTPTVSMKKYLLRLHKHAKPKALQLEIYKKVLPIDWECPSKTLCEFVSFDSVVSVNCTLQIHIYCVKCIYIIYTYLHG